MSFPHYPHAPGHPPAGLPGAPGDEPPIRPKRIESMAIAVELWLIVLVARMVAEFGSYPAVKAMMADQVAARKDLPADTAKLVMSPAVLITSMVVGAVVITAVALAVMWFAREGYNWARLLLAGASLYVVISTIWGVAVVGASPSWIAVPLIVAGVAALGAIFALLRRDTESWCADMALFRSRRRAPKYPHYPAAGNGSAGNGYRPGGQEHHGDR